MRRTVLTILTALGSVLAGCAGAPVDVAPLAPEAVAVALAWAAPGVVVASCENPFAVCFEPSVAADPEGRLFVANALTGSLVVSTDGGATWTPRADPPMPAPASPALFQSDVLVQTAPDGALYYSALLVSGAGVLAGMQVAASRDGAESWDTNVLLAPPATSSTLGADRQWLAFGADGVVWASYHQIPPAPSASPLWAVYNDLRVARSTDGGATWSAFAQAVPTAAYIAGPPVVDADGRFLYPTFVRDADGGRLEIVATSDLATFERLVVWAPDSGAPGDYFPSVVQTPDGALVAIWKDADAALRAARSTDAGATWSEPATWSLASETVTSSPWVVAREDGRLDVAYFVEAGDGARLAHARADAIAGVLARGTVADVARAQGSRSPANTDFAHVVPFAGGLAATWTSAEAGILVALGSDAT